MTDDQHIEQQDGIQPPDQPGDDGSTPQTPALFEKSGGDWRQADQSYWNIVNQRKEIEQKLAREQARAQELEQILIQNFNQPRQPYAPVPDPTSRLREMGMPVEDIVSLVQQIAEERAGRIINPLIQTVQAREQVASRYPDFVQSEGAAISHVRSDPSLSQVYDSMVASNPQAALDWAYTKYQNSEMQRKRTTTPAPLPPEAAQSRAAAGLPGVGGNRSASTPQTARDKAIAEAAQYARDTKDTRPYVSEIFKGVPLTWEEVQAAKIAAEIRRQSGG